MADSTLPDLSQRDDIDAILIVRLKALGDIVLSLPIITALRMHFPNAWIGYLCREQYAEALAGDTGLDEILTLPRQWIEQGRFLRKLRRQRLDLVVDLLSSPRSALITWLSGGRMRIGMDVGRHRWCYHYVLPRAIIRDGRIIKRYTMVSNWEIVRLLGLAEEYAGLVGAACGSVAMDAPAADRTVADSRMFDYRIGFPAAEGERGWARDYIAGLGMDAGNLVGIVPGATYHSKSWPVENFVALSRMLTTRLGLTPFVIWGPGEEELARRIHDEVPGSILAPETGVARLGALIARLPLLVTLDSGPKHIAVVEGTPTITLFGPTDPAVWDPLTGRHVAIHKNLDCFPCREKTCEPNRCLVDITPQEVLDAVVAYTAAGREEGISG